MAPAGFAGNASRSAGLSVFRYAGFFHASMTCWCDIELFFMVLFNCGLTYTPASLSAVLNSVLREKLLGPILKHNCDPLGKSDEDGSSCAQRTARLHSVRPLDN